MKAAFRKLAPQKAETLFRRGGGEGQYIRDFGEGRIHAIKHIFSQEFSTSFLKLCFANRREQSSP